MTYTKHDYKSGEKLYAEQLNEMDEQIAKNAESVTSLTEEMAALKGGIQPDWNQNDPTAPDYVKNRTHYSESKEVIIVPETTVTVGQLMGGAGFSLNNPTQKPFVEGQLYTVTWQGNVYEAVAGLIDGVAALLIEQDGLMMIGVLPNEPDLVAVITDGLRGEEATIKITTIDETVHTIDPKFLPPEKILVYQDESTGGWECDLTPTEILAEINAGNFPTVTVKRIVSGSYNAEYMQFYTLTRFEVTKMPEEYLGVEFWGNTEYHTGDNEIITVRFGLTDGSLAVEFN